MGTLDGKIAVVTGAGRGIGKAIVKRFLEDGARGVAIFEVSEALAQEAAAELDPTGERVLAVPCNVANREQVRAAVDAVVEHFGQIDILVNNAGITRDRIFHKMSDEQWDDVVAVNLNGTYNTCRTIVPMLREQGWGRIVNIASTSAWGNPGQANYAATKAAIMGFTATLAKEVAGKGVIVNAVAPGGIDTDMYAAVPPEKQAAYINSLPMKRLGDPSEVAGVVSFLCGPDVTYLTAQCISVSGGARSF